MASDELTGGTKLEIAKLREEYQERPLCNEHGVSFEAFYCLREIARQPPDYDGPQRYCMNQCVRRDEYDNGVYEDDVYTLYCLNHGLDCNGGKPENLNQPETSNLRHGLYAEDEHLRMDFTDAEQELYDNIVEVWPEVYDWPAEDNDPARYLILREVAANVVRSNRAKDYIDDEGEVHFRAIFDEDGIQVGEEPEENPLAREYRLLFDEILDALKELGLTPKERAKMDKNEAKADAASTVADLAGDAIDDGGDYDPEEFIDDEQS